MRPGDCRGGKRDVDDIGVEFHGQPLIGVLRHRRGGARRRLNRDARAGANLFLADRDVRHAQIADDQQTRRAAELEPLVVNRQRARG